MRRQHKPRIYKRQTSKGKYTFYVDCGKINSKRERLKCSSYAEAVEVQEKVFKERLKHGNAKVVELNEVARSEAVFNLKRLQEYGATLTQAVDFFIKFSKPTQGHLSIDDAIELWTAAKTTRGNRAHSIKKTADSFYKPFSKHFGGNVLTSSLSQQDMEQYLHSHNSWGELTFNNHLRNLSSLYNFLVKKGHCTLNPLKHVESKKVVQEVKLLTPEQVKNALQYCIDKKKKPYLPALIILIAFCGVRDHEVEMIGWEDIDLKRKEVKILPKNAKKSKLRVNEIPKVALLWFKKIPFGTGKIVPVSSSGKQMAKNRLWKEVGVVCPQNAIRHCFATYHLNMYKKSTETAKLLGHPNPQLLHSTYAEWSNKEEAEKFWRIIPNGIEDELKEEKRKELIADLYQNKGQLESQEFASYSDLNVDEEGLKIWDNYEEDGVRKRVIVRDYASFLEKFDIFDE
jgi:integrase